MLREEFSPHRRTSLPGPLPVVSTYPRAKVEGAFFSVFRCHQDSEEVACFVLFTAQITNLISSNFVVLLIMFAANIANFAIQKIVAFRDDIHQNVSEIYRFYQENLEEIVNQILDKLC